LITVVIVNWNRSKLLRSCLNSLRAQAHVRFETVVVDNGSTDDSRAVASEFGVRLICNETNRGFCEANNQGIAAAKGEYVALLNNDAEAEPGWLAGDRDGCE